MQINAFVTLFLNLQNHLQREVDDLHAAEKARLKAEEEKERARIAELQRLAEEEKERLAWIAFWNDKVGWQGKTERECKRSANDDDAC